MPFVSDSQFEKQEKIQEFRKKINEKKEQAYINEQVKSDEKKKPLKMDNKQIIKEVMKNTSKEIQKNSKPKPITLKELQNSIKIEQFVETVREDEINKILDNDEIQEVKNEFVTVLSLTHTDPIKRKIFEDKLQKSKTINNYVNNNLILRLFSRVNDNLKFGVVYGMKYLQTNSDYERMLLIQKNST